MTLVELLAQNNIAYVNIEPVFPGPTVSLMVFDKPKDGVRFAAWKKGKFVTREDFTTEEEAVAYMQRLMSNDQ
jgi:hypothetical protein